MADKKLQADFSKKHDPKYCGNTQNGKGGPIEDKLSQYLKEISGRLDKDEDIFFDVKERAKQEGCGIPPAELEGAKTGEEFLDLLQNYGIISRYHHSYIPWLLRKADGGRDLVKDWNNIVKSIPQAESLFVSNLPALPKGNFRLEIQVQLPEDRSVHVFHLQKQLNDTFDNLPIELISFLGATCINEDLIILTIQMPSYRRGKKLKNISKTLHNSLSSVPHWINENNVVGTHVGNKCYVTFKEVDEGSEEPVDLTRVPHATGQEVVHRTVELVRNIFPDKGILRRIAWVETGDGGSVDEDEENTGGIWKVSGPMFQKTKQNVSENPQLREKIEAEFGIAWEELEYEDCDQPLISALTARLYILPPAGKKEEIPDESDVKKQALYWKEHYRDDDDDEYENVEASLRFVTKVEKIAEEEEHNVSKMDLAVVLDGSASVQSDGFEKAKNFILRLMNNLTIGMEEVRIGVLQFSSSQKIRIEFPMNTHTSKDTLTTAIKEIKFQDGNGTYLGKTLTKMAERLFHADNGARPQIESVPRVAIVMTDGQSHDGIKEPAEHARSLGITVIAIGIGSDIKSAELDQIANKPSEKYSVKDIQGFEHVENILGKVLAEASKAPVEIAINKAIKGTSEKKGEKRRFCFPIPIDKKYVTVSMQICDGEGTMYLSTSHDPSAVAYQWKLETSSKLSFNQAQVKLSKALEGGKNKIYATFENSTSRREKEKQQLTTFYVIVEDGDKKIDKTAIRNYGDIWRSADSTQ